MIFIRMVKEISDTLLTGTKKPATWAGFHIFSYPFILTSSLKRF